MSNEVIKDEILSGNVNFLDSVQFSSDNKIFTDKEISKVIFATSDACVLHTEVLDEQMHVSGKVISNITFLTVDGQMESANAEMEFNEIIRDGRIKQGDELCVSANVVDSTIQSVSAGEVSIKTIVELSSKLISSENVSYVTGGGDGLYVLDDNFTNKFLTKSGKEDISFEIEIPVKDGAVKVLSSSACLNIKNIKSKSGIIQIDATAFYNLLLSEDDKLKVVNDESQVSEEIAFDGVDEYSIICGKLHVCTCEVVQNDNNSILRIGAMFCFDVYEEKTLNFVSDAFSTTNEINLKVISALQNRFAYNFSEDTEIVGNISVKDDGFEIRKIIGALPKCLVFSKVSNEVDGTLVEGVATFTAIYEGVDDQIDSVDVEIPFSTNVNISNMEQGQTLLANACVFDVKTKIRKANEIEISAEILMCFNVFENNQFAYVSDIEIGEEKMADESALMVYVVKENEGIFDIAKKLSLDIAELKAQNPALEEGLDKGMSITYYKQKKIN